MTWSDRRPRLLLAQSDMAAMRGDVETMEPLIAAAEEAAVGATDEPFTPTAGRAGSLLVNVPAVIALNRSYAAQLRGDAEGTAVHTASALAQVRDGEDTLSSSIEGFLGMAEWLRGRLPRGRAGVRLRHRRVAERRSEHLDGVDGLLTGPNPARPRPPRRGHPDLQAGSGVRRHARPAGPTGCWTRVGWPRRGGLPAQRSRRRARLCHRGRRPLPAVRLHPDAGRRPDDAGVDPPGER